MAELFQVVLWTFEIGGWLFLVGAVILIFLVSAWFFYSRGFQDGMKEERLEHTVDDRGQVTCCEHGVPHRYTCSQCTQKYLEELRSMHSGRGV